MFEKHYEERLAAWSEFRSSLEEDDDPFRRVIDLYEDAPKVSIHTDPWTPEMWPNPWELVNENQYDDFCRVLGMCYSLQLTDRFKGSSFEIHIYVDDNIGYRYLLRVDNFILGYNDEYFHKNMLPKNLKPQHVYPMPALQ